MAPLARLWRGDRPGLHLKLACAAAFLLVLAAGGRSQDTLPDQPDQKASSGVSISRIEPGFSDGAYNVVRADYCVPVRIQIHNRTGARFFGTLQVISRDRDGETVIHELPGFAVDSGAIDDKQLSFFARNPGCTTRRPRSPYGCWTATIAGWSLPRRRCWNTSRNQST